MQEDGKHEEGFKIVDRRRFDADGTTKKGAAEDLPRRDDVRVSSQASSPPKANAAPPSEQGGLDFLTFVSSLGATALAALGALPKGAVGDVPENFELAREYIDVLGMLQDKTRGNLTAEEDHGLQRLLGDLRLQFVEQARRKNKGRRQ